MEAATARPTIHTTGRLSLTTPLVLGAALFTAAGGYVHAREWADTYRHIPAEVPGAALVRVGFPVNAAISAVLALALVATALWFRRLAPYVMVAALLFEAGSLASLLVSRTGSLFGWMEPVWTTGANQTRAVEIGALVTLGAALAISRLSATTEPAAPR